MGLGFQETFSKLLGSRNFKKRERLAWEKDFSRQTPWRPQTAMNWTSVDRDALVFLLPQLVQENRRTSSGGVERYLRKAIDDQMPCAQSAVMDCGLVTNSRHARALLERACAEPIQLFEDDGPMPHRAANEVRIFVYLNKFLHAATSEKSAADVFGRVETTGLSDVLVGSIYTGINGGYVFPEFDWAHELLATGTWLGHVRAGRPALLLDFLADCLLDYEEAAERNDNSESALCARLMRRHAARAIDMDRLLAVARSVRAGGNPVVVHPKRREH